MRALVISELRQRVRGKRWWIMLIFWVLVQFGLLSLVRSGAQTVEQSSNFDYVGPIMFGSLVLMVMGLSALVMPSLTATSINGERDRGTLAVLQATLLRPRHIVGAKFIASAATALGFLLATVPLGLWAATEGGIGLGRFLATYAVLFVGSMLFILIGLATSAAIRRSSLSATTTYLVVAALTIGSPILFALSMLGAPVETRTFETPQGETTTTVTDPGLRWLLLAPNPFVVLADAAPRDGGRDINEPLEAIREGVRSVRSETPDYPADPGFNIIEPPEPPPVWPFGLAIDVGLAVLAWFVCTARLQLPATKLGPGERVA
jgi:ABC-type transport system involved in multi-copper enzyme maturation permease subunit